MGTHSDVHARFLVLAMTVSLIVAVWGTADPAPAAAAAGGLGPTVQLAIGSQPQSSSTYAFYVGFARVIGKYLPSVNPTIRETGASVDNIRLLSKNQIQMGLVTQDTAFQATHGLGAFKDAKLEKLRTLFIYTHGPQFYMVRKDSGVTSLEQLNGKPFGPGFSGSATESVTMQLFKSLGIEPKWFKGSLADLITAVKDGAIIGFPKGGTPVGLDASFLDIKTTIPITILSFSENQKAKLAKEFPYLVWVNFPDGRIRGVGPVRTWTVVTSVGATSDLDQTLAYDVIRAAVEHQDELAASYKPVGNANLIEDTLSLSTVPLSAGSVQYFQEKGVKVPAKLIPPEYKKR